MSPTCSFDPKSIFLESPTRDLNLKASDPQTFGSQLIGYGKVAARSNKLPLDFMTNRCQFTNSRDTPP
eukprot:6456376-Amphidinium_carterae.1